MILPNMRFGAILIALVEWDSKIIILVIQSYESDTTMSTIHIENVLLVRTN